MPCITTPTQGSCQAECKETTWDHHVEDPLSTRKGRKVRSVASLIDCIALKGTTWGSSSIYSGCLLDDSLWRCSRQIQLGGDNGADPEYAGRTVYPIWPLNILGSPRKSCRTRLWRGSSGLLCFACCLQNSDPDEQLKMNGWMDGLPLLMLRCVNSLPKFKTANRQCLGLSISNTWMREAAAGICRLKCFCLCFCCTFRANPDPRIPWSENVKLYCVFIQQEKYILYTEIIYARVMNVM